MLVFSLQAYKLELYSDLSTVTYSREKIWIVWIILSVLQP